MPRALPDPPAVLLAWASRAWAPHRISTPPADGQTKSTGRLPLPPPTLPEEDTGSMQLEDLISLAVALDVLSTWTTPLRARPEVLDDLTNTLLRVAAVGGEGAEEHIRSILALAAGPTGAGRAALTGSLAELLGGSPNVEGVPVPGTPFTTPGSVETAMRRVEAAARLVVREACLLLAAREAMESRHV
jgi:hypothetical protein